MRKETQAVEFKQSWRDEYLKWICGFANAHGGKLLIGVDDAGMAVGVPNAKKLMEDIPNKIRDTMGIVADVSLRKRKGKDVIEIVVRESDFPVAYRGEYHYRTGSTKQQLTGFALTQFLFHKMHLSWDGAETAGRLAFRKYTFKRLALRYEEKTGRAFKPTWFVSTGLSTKDGVLTNAGALFADDCPIPQSRLFCTVWNGLTKSKDSGNDKEFSGNLIELLDTAEHFIQVNTVRKWKKRPCDRVDYPDYPERAVTEALVNAFVHRDYTMYGSEVHVDIYPDRLEVVSPGGMPDGSLVQELDLRNVASDRRNPILADLFAQMDYMERKGSGFGTILDAYEKEAPNPRGLKPEFFSTSGSFRVVLPNLNREAGGMSGGKGAEWTHSSHEPTNEAGGPITSRFDPTNEPINGEKEPISEPLKSGKEPMPARVLEHVRQHPGEKRGDIVEALGISLSTARRALKALGEQVEYRGSKKTGGYFAKDG